MTKFKVLITFVSLSLFLSVKPVLGTHLIGGYMYYTPSSFEDSLFQISMVLMRDEFSGGAVFDQTVSIQIFSRDENGEYEYIETTEQVIDSSKTIKWIDEDDRSIIRVENAYCHFLYKIENMSKDLVFVYQRCCLSPLISNLELPEDNGFSVVGMITSEAVNQKNTSATFSKLPSMVGRTNVLNTIDLNIFDTDGDSLVVDFSVIPSGGGIDGALGVADPNTCEGIIPTGPCPPPYNSLVYLDNNSIIKGWESLDIDVARLEGTPTELGFSLYAFVIKEYRNNILINEQRVIYPMFTFAQEVTNNVMEVDHSAFIYPNPSKGFFRISMEHIIDKVGIYDVNGSLLFEKQCSKKVVDLNTDLPSGIYFVAIKGPDAYIFRKIVIE